MEEPPPLETCDDTEDLAVLLARGADDELGRRAGGSKRQRRLRKPPLEHQAARPLEIRQEIAGKVFLARKRADVRGARRFEIDRHAAGEPDGRVDLGGLGAREELQVDIATEVLAVA